LQAQLIKGALNKSDIVYTPDWCACDIISWYKPSGDILEPCKGDGAFLRYLPQTTKWCEISEGIDFFAWIDRVDWIIGNPPYSIFDEWLERSFNLAEDIVYLLPLHIIFRAFGRMKLCYKYGWIKHIRIYGTGSLLGFPTGNAVGAVHFVREYWGDTSWSWYMPPNKHFQGTPTAAPSNGGGSRG
jgi:hypothetical protein